MAIFDVLNGWLATLLVTNTTTSILFATLLFASVLLLVWLQFAKDEFDIRDVVCTWDNASKKKIVSTSKTLLTGTFLTSSYVLIEHYSDAGLGLYLAAWVLNGGIVAWQKTQQSAGADQPTGLLK